MTHSFARRGRDAQELSRGRNTTRRDPDSFDEPSPEELGAHAITNSSDEPGYYVRNQVIAPKTCYFYSDGNQYRQPHRVPVAWDRYRSLNSLLQDLTLKVTDLRYGVRAIFTPKGRHRISSLDQLKNEGDYVCSDSRVRAKGVDIYGIHVPTHWRGGQPPSMQKRYVELLRSAKRSSRRKRERTRRPLQTRSLPASNSSQDSGGNGFHPVAVSRLPRVAAIPRDRRVVAKRVLVYLNGDALRRHVVRLDKRTASFDQVLEDLSVIFNKSLKKMFDQRGVPVESVAQILNGSDTFVVSCGEAFKPPSNARGSTRRPPPRRLPQIPDERARGDLVRAGGRSKGRWLISLTTSAQQPNVCMSALACITVYGKRGVSDAIPLNSPLNPEGADEPFAPGQTDEFEINTGKIGSITKIRLSHDNSGPSPHWYLDNARMKDLDTNEVLIFLFNRWLSRDQDDGDICRELPAIRPAEKVLPLTRYRLDVFTGNCWNAGTSAHVFVTLYGDQGDSGVRQLIRPLINKGRVFQKGEVDAFEIEAVSVGKLRRLIVGHDNRTAGQGWFLDRVIVRDVGKPKHSETVFPCSRWLDEGEDDGKTTRELRVSDELQYELLAKEVWEYERWKYRMENQLQFYNKLTGNLLRIKADSSVDAMGDEADIYTRLHCLCEDKNVIVLRSVVVPRFHLCFDGAILTGQGRGTPDCELVVRVQPDRMVMLESADSPGQFLNFGEDGQQADARRGGAAPAPGKLFVTHCRGAFRREGIVMFCTSLTQTLSLDHENALHATGKRNRMAHFRVHKIEDACVAMFESVVFAGQFLRLKDGRCDCAGTGDASCCFRVVKHKDLGFVTLESHQQAGIFIGITPDGRIRPTVNTGQDNVRLFPEVIKFGIPKGTARPTPMPVPPTSPKPASPVVSSARTSMITRRTPSISVASPETAQRSPEEWKVSVRSAEAVESGNVLLFVYGDSGICGPLELSNAGGENFKGGATDDFEVALPGVGTLKKIRVELQPETNFKTHASWKLDSVTLLHHVTGDSQVFNFGGRYLGRDFDDAELAREMAVAGGPPVVKYDVTIATGNLPAAETSSRVTVCLNGENSDSGKRMMFSRNDRKVFKRGQTDVFQIEAVHLGELQHIDITVDGQQPGQGWYCENVRVVDPLEKKSYYFPCKNWLDAGMGDKKLERRLIPEDEPPEEATSTTLSDPEEDEKKEIHALGRWAVQITTGSQGDMGCTNDAFLEVYGTDGRSDLLLLKSVTEKGKFAPNSIEEVPLQVDLSGLGTFYKLRIGQTDADALSGWFVIDVRLRSVDRPDEVFSAKVGRWMSRTTEDFDVVREVPVGPELHPVLIYVVEIESETAPSLRAASTAFAQLFGTRGDSGKRLLYKSRTNEEKFKAGQTDTFHIEAVSLDDVTHMAIGHEDRSNEELDWRWTLSKVTVSTVEADHRRRWRFTIPTDEVLQPGLFRLELEAAEDAAVEQEEPSRSLPIYHLTLRTGQDSAAGRAGHPGRLYAELIGDRGTSGEVLLNEGQNRGQFSPGGEDSFQFTCFEELGQLRKLRVSVDVQDEWHSWQLLTVSLSTPAGGERTLHVDRCLGRAVNAANAVEVSLATEDTAEDTAVRRYEAAVHVGQRHGAESCAELFLTVCGTEGDSGRRWLLHDSQGGVACFKPGMTRSFRFEAVTLGQLTHVIVGHTAHGPGAGLFLDRVTVREMEGERSHLESVFPCGRWLDSAVSDAKLQLELGIKEVVDHEQEASRLSTSAVFSSGRYLLTLKTAKDSPADFHGPIFVTCFGKGGAVNRQELKKSEDDGGAEFPPGQSVEFEVAVADEVGQLTRIQLDAMGADGSWLCEGIHLADPTSGAVFRHFPAFSLSSSGPLREFPLLRQMPVPYRVSLEADQPVPPHLRLELFGAGGLDSGPRPVPADAELEIETVDLQLVERAELSFGKGAPDEEFLLQRLRVRAGPNALHEVVFENSNGIPIAPDRPLLLHGGTTVSVAPAAATGGRWRVAFRTGPERGGLRPVTLTLCGARAQSEGQRLCPTEPGRFAPGSEHEFLIDSGDIGPLVKVLLDLGPKEEEEEEKKETVEKEEEWHLSLLRLEETQSGQTYVFPVDRLVSPNQPLELLATSPDTPTLPLITYLVAVRTGRWSEETAAAATDLCVRLLGSVGDSPWRRLIRHGGSDPNTAPFVPGEASNFEISCLDVGKITGIRLSHTQAGMGRGIYVERVAITYYDFGMKTLYFPCNRWLDTGWGDGALETELQTTSNQAAASRVQYEVQLESDEAAELAKAVLHLELTGDDGRRTEKVALEVKDTTESNVSCLASTEFLLKIEGGVLTSSGSSAAVKTLAVRKVPFGPATFLAEKMNELGEDGSQSFVISKEILQSVSEKDLTAGYFGSEWTVKSDKPLDPSLPILVIFCEGSEESDTAKITTREGEELVGRVRVDIAKFANIRKLRLKLDTDQPSRTLTVSKLQFIDSFSGAAFAVRLDDNLLSATWAECPVTWPGRLPVALGRYLVTLIFGEAGVSSRAVSVTLQGANGTSGSRVVTSQAEAFESCKFKMDAVDLGQLVNVQVDVEREAIGLEEDAGPHLIEVLVDPGSGPQSFPCDKWLSSRRDGLRVRLERAPSRPPSTAPSTAAPPPEDASPES